MESYLNIDDLTALGMIFLRMSGCIMFNPIFGRRNMPNLFKAGMAVIFAVLVYNFADVPSMAYIDDTVQLVVLGVKELLIGFALGFVASLFSYIIILGGEIIDMQIGLAMAKVYDPSSNVSMSLSATYFNVIYMVIFFTIGGHLTLSKLFIESGELIPYGQGVFGEDVAVTMIAVFAQCTILGIKLAMPFIAIEFMMEMGVGILMKNVPQINVLMVNIQAKVFLGLLFMMMIFTPILGFIEDIIEQLFDAVIVVAETMG